MSKSPLTSVLKKNDFENENQIHIYDNKGYENNIEVIFISVKNYCI